jgi:hypothetical protein
MPEIIRGLFIFCVKLLELWKSWNRRWQQEQQLKWKRLQFSHDQLVPPFWYEEQKLEPSLSKLDSGDHGLFIFCVKLLEL